MNDENSAQSSAIARFRALHESGCFVLPNPWDAGTAVYLQQLGFKASAGFAFSRGKPDGAILFGEMLSHIGEVVAATRPPVNADFLNGFADEPDGIRASALEVER
jgi:2-methylisocitrate lyase-like PEP mutase family enzyme